MQAGVANLYRDAWGVPHIYAEREEDGFYALGYAQAEDQMIGVLSAALAVDGKAGAQFGDGMLPWDLPVGLMEPASLVWRQVEEAKAAYGRLPPNIRRNQDAWAEGFNAYLAEHPEKVPAWAPKIEGWHAIAIPHTLLWFFMSGDGQRDCARSGLKLTAALSETPVRQFASNEWAVAAQHTMDGKAILLSDPHSIVNGSLFYEFRMKAGGLDVVGYTFLTTMMLTHSDRVAWGMTTGGPDASDCYALTLDPKNPNRYRIHGKWRIFEHRSWTREVKDRGEQRGETDYAQINGLFAPVVARGAGKAYALVSPYANDAGGLLEQMDAWVRARDIKDLIKASDRLGMFPQNVAAADSGGSIYYLRAGRVPRRDPAIDWTKPVSGDDARTRWRGLRSNAEMVQVLNPPNGYLQNDNTPPENIASAPLIRPADYPADVYNSVPELRFMSRANRGNAYLDAHPKLTVQQAQQLALDETWIGAERFTQLLRQAIDGPGDKQREWGEPERRMLARLLSFDGAANSQSAAALNHFFWRTTLWNSLDAAQQARLGERLSHGGPLDDTIAAKMIDAVRLGAAAQQKAVGSVDAAYGDYFRISRDGVRSWPLGGGPPIDLQDYFRCAPLEKAPYVCALTQRAYSFGNRLADGRMRVTEGSRALRLVVLGDPVRTYSLHNYGQSDDPASPHYDDQARLLASPKTLKSVPFRFEELAPEAAQSRVLVRKAPAT
jgi:acyl-homoserine lactone acylase PvdQ